MFRFRILLILTAAWLTLIFNLERPEIVGIGNIDLASLVYVLAAGVMVVIVLLPELGKKWTYEIFLPVLAIYSIAKLILDHRSFSDAMFVYITVTEIAVLFATIKIARIVSRAVADFEFTVENAILGSGESRVLNATDGKDTIDKELLRARRFDRPVALLYLQIKSLEQLSRDPMKYFDSKKALEHRYLQTRIAKTLEAVLHESDIMIWNNGGLVICMPETTAQEAANIARKIHDLIRLEMTIGVACFPNDALIYNDLVTEAKNNPWHPGKENVIPLRKTEQFFTNPVDAELQKMTSV